MSDDVILPVECWSSILSYLDFDNLVVMSRVCRIHRVFVTDILAKKWSEEFLIPIPRYANLSYLVNNWSNSYNSPFEKILGKLSDTKIVCNIRLYRLTFNKTFQKIGKPKYSNLDKFSKLESLYCELKDIGNTKYHHEKTLLGNKFNGSINAAVDKLSHIFESSYTLTNTPMTVYLIGTFDDNLNIYLMGTRKMEQITIYGLNLEIPFVYGVSNHWHPSISRLSDKPLKCDQEMIYYNSMSVMKLNRTVYQPESYPENLSVMYWDLDLSTNRRLPKLSGSVISVKRDVARFIKALAPYGYDEL